MGGKGGIEDLPMLENFSADLLAIESYWTESHLKLCQTSMTELLCERMWSTFR